MTSEANNGTGRRTVRIGVFIPTECQLLDAASVDIMGSMSHEYMTMISDFMPKAIVDLAPVIKIHYIGSVQAGEPIKLTSNESIVATNHFSDAEVAPGKLDIVLVPGPDPKTQFADEPIAWLRAQGNTAGVDILSVCTGIFLCGQAGLLKGKNVCGPRSLQDMIKAKGFGEKALVGGKYRWNQDGNLWSSGGVTNGNDLVAAYARASPHHFPAPIVKIACEMTDTGDRAREYEKEMMDYPEFLKSVVAAVK
ncbi:ThiJ/PfpI family protein [Hypomontagnella monticulosa]|nr:ThiJ/PfpI family protein [Hypomontagnella monticulosa]